MELHIYSFEKLTAWKELRFLVTKIYAITQKFPHDELFGLTNQLRRAAVSAASNLAEGSGRTSKKDQSHFYTVAYSSVMEILAQVIIATDLAYMTEEEQKEVRVQIQTCGFLLNKLKKATELA